MTREIDHSFPPPCDGIGCNFAKVIYCGLPGRLCLRCNTLEGLATYAPPIASEGPDGEPSFAFYPYEGAYLPALWGWFWAGFKDDA